MKQKYVDLYMDFAERVAELSYAERKKVGAVIVNDDTVVYGYNGTPKGWDNCCEDKEYTYDARDVDAGWSYDSETKQYWRLKTRPEVLHAESNAVGKLARSVVNGKGADLFVTLSPCLECAKLIHQTGIKRVFYREGYRTNEGINFLQRSGIEVIQVKKGE